MQAAILWQAVSELEAVTAEVAAAIPAHWRGRAAESFRRTSEQTVTSLRVVAEEARQAASLVHQHDQAVSATRAALASGGMVAV